MTFLAKQQANGEARTDPMRVVSVRLDKDLEGLAAKIGRGNVSQGIRVALRAYERGKKS